MFIINLLNTLCLLECLYSYIFYIYWKVLFIIVKDISEYFTYCEVCIHQKVIL